MTNDNDKTQWPAKLSLGPLWDLPEHHFLNSNICTYPLKGYMACVMGESLSYMVFLIPNYTDSSLSASGKGSSS